MRRSLAFGSALLVAAVACSTFGSEDGPAGSSGGGGDAGSGALDGALGDAGDEASSDAGNGCPWKHGPKPVKLDGFCIDSTEVTSAHYVEFLNAKGSDLSGQHPACADNTSYLPQHDWPGAAGTENHPVRGVDWCDAWAFCAWAGKRLCGRLGGGAVPPVDNEDPDQSEWMRACTAGGTKTFPYGNSYDGGACNGKDARDPDRLAAVGTFEGCEGGYEGVFDMSGNAWEWEDSCSATGPDAGCTIRGGDESQSQGTLGCGSAVTQPRFDTGRWGIRCCSAAPE